MKQFAANTLPAIKQHLKEADFRTRLRPWDRRSVTLVFVAVEPVEASQGSLLASPRKHEIASEPHDAAEMIDPA